MPEDLATSLGFMLPIPRIAPKPSAVPANSVAATTIARNRDCGPVGHKVLTHLSHDFSLPAQALDQITQRTPHEG